MKLLSYEADMADPCGTVLVRMDEWPETIRIRLDGMFEAPTVGAIERMAAATVERMKREKALADMRSMKERPSLPAGRHEAYNFK